MRFYQYFQFLRSYTIPQDKLNAAITSLKSILAKYKMDKLDRSKLTKTDLEKVNELDNIIEPAQRHLTFIKDIEHIKVMVKASEIMYEAKKSSMKTYNLPLVFGQ